VRGIEHSGARTVARLAIALAGTLLPIVAHAQENGTAPAAPTPAISSAVQARARASSVMRRHITIDLKRVPLADALLAIAQGAGAGLVHGDDVASDSSLVTVHLVNVELGKAFEQVL
jgi:hypothetical protein